MNLPNRLSVTRIILVPFLVLFMTLPWETGRYLAAFIFLIGSLTDYFDGRIARKNNLITDFGKFLDPLADKLLVLSALIMLAVKGIVPAWLSVLVLARELSVDGLRMILSSKGTVIAASMTGKIKTTSQMLYILLLLLLDVPVTSNIFLLLFTAWVAVITLYSGFEYFRAYGKDLITEGL